MKSGIVYILGILALTTGLYTFTDYQEYRDTIRGNPVVSHILDVDMTDPRAEIRQGLSFGLLYGFQKTSEIAKAYGAAIAVNGMFYDDLGMPIGILVDEGVPIRISDAGTPVVIIGDNNDITLTEVTSSARMLVADGYAWLYSVNGRVPDGGWGLFYPVFGKTTRIQRQSTNYMIRENKIVDILYTDSPVALGEYQMVLTYAGDDHTFAIGDSVAIDCDFGIDDFKVKTAFQAGGWLVKDGINVAEAYDEFIGYTTAPQPRTLVGVTEENHLILMVVDGRSPGYSLGVSGFDAAELMIDYGCVDAAYLDGGASTTLYYDGQVINQPSGSDEREVAHAILVMEQGPE